jgi:glycosyltransferase involved in cell wall biosynthesis
MHMVNFVSVVIPTRNRCARLLEAIASVRAQTGVDFEIIVVDDASSDETPQALPPLCREEPRLRYVRNESPLGGSGARNAGAALARGEFVAFLDDDDCFLPGKLERQVAVLRSSPDALAASGSFWLYFEGRQSVRRLLRSPRSRAELLRANILGGASVCMVREEVFRKVGGFDPLLPSCQDWDLWLKLHARGGIVVCEEPLVRYSLHAGSQITGNTLAEYRGRRRIHLKYVAEMSPELRRSSVAGLLYYRRVRFGIGSVRRAFGLVSVLLLAPSLESIAYIWRTLRLAIRGQLAQTHK